MKKKIVVPLLLLSTIIFSSASLKGFWELYVSGPDNRCDLDQWGWGAWTIEDTWGDPVDPANQYYWYVNDYQARQEGYPSYSLGRPAYDIDRECNASLSFGEGIDELDEVTITCRITSNGQTRYEGFVVINCE